MRGRYKRKDPEHEPELCPRPGGSAAGLTETHTPVPRLMVQDVGGGNTGSKCSSYGGDKVYLGVRVNMPVKDLLRNIRVAQGWDPQDFQETSHSKTLKGDRKRVKTRTGRRTTKRKRPTKSLEELAIIVEVLEEDLRTGNTYRSPPQTLSPSASPVSSEWSPDSNGADYNSDKSDEMISSPESYVTYSPGTAESQQAMSPPGFTYTNLQPPKVELAQEGNAGSGDEWLGPRDEWLGPQNQDWNLSSSAFFWMQLQREESQLMDVSDAALLATDEHGRTALHEVACIGKRAMGYAIAKRMAALNSLDLKDSDGMTPILHAAKHNHHLMVADLICLGANVNERNNSGKSCLHLSAEKGYIRVLEVLKQTMMDGVRLDFEATDNSGMSVLQCASVALKATVHELESSKSLNHIRLHTLRKEQMIETLECLLQMGSYPHIMGGQCMQSR